MAIVSKTTLKTYFEDGKEPHEGKYIDLIDTMVASGADIPGPVTIVGDLTVTNDFIVDDDLTVKGGLMTGLSSAPFVIPNGTIFIHDGLSTDYGFVSAEGPLFLSSNTYYDGTNWRTIKIGKSSTMYVDAVTGLMFRSDTTSRAAGAVSAHVTKMTLSMDGNLALAGGIVVGNVGGVIDDDNVTFYQDGTRIGEIGSDNTSFLKLNHVTNLPIYTPRYMRVDGGLSATSSISDAGDGNFAGQKFNIYEGTTLMGGLTCNEATWLRINQDAAYNIYTPRFFAAAGGLQAGGSTDPGDGYVGYTNGLRPNKNSTQYSAYGYHGYSNALTSTLWDGDAKGNTTGTVIDLSATFGVPAGVTAVNVRLIAKANNAGPTDSNYFFLGPSAAYDDFVGVYPWGNVYMDQTGIVSCDANGDIWYQIASGATCYCFLKILGYFI